MSVTVAHENHYVPQGLLRRWADKSGGVSVYRTLVSHPNVPLWTRQFVRASAKATDLYTLSAIDTPEDDDGFERFLATEIEHPGHAALERLVSGSRLTRDDWYAIGRYAVAQDIRTPQSYLESLERWNREIPEAFEDAVRHLDEKLRVAAPTNGPAPKGAVSTPISGALRVEVHPAAPESPNEVQVEMNVSSGRHLWLGVMKHLLINTAPAVLRRLQWRVARPAPGFEWPLTDHPLVRLNYFNAGHYDFRGGWGKTGSEIMMPVSPQQLLYTQIDHRHECRFTFSPEHTRLIQRLLVERAFRVVFVTRREEWVPNLRPRVVDKKLYDAERAALAAWDDVHSEREREFLSGQLSQQ